ncbi:MAG: DUF4333 domain-containing protein [Solirubrobacterales bacterium]
MHSRAAIALAAPALALALAACGGTVIDDAKAEDAIRDDIETNLGVEVRSVECPSDVEVEPGTTFECAVVAKGGGRATATLRILDSDADVRFVDLRATGRPGSQPPSK